jgi:hypothetical protein
MSLPFLLVGKLASLPSMRRHLGHCCDGNCCSCHNGLITVVDAQVCLRHCQASVIALVACCQADIVTHIAMALLPLMRRVFAVVVIAIVALMAMALLPLLMRKCPCCCQESVVALIKMVPLPLIRNGVVARIMMALLLSSSWHCCCHH